ncbi:kelch-like protein 11 [Zeugodacus cucurbitae]|uniref:kelch-like protein 11 n=1 Tax=Zeugodacus cucurbitae TaxID=28588 RepID=UPI0023D9024D|nr:kelch-like protein 11 [Zeugodacus cucurbitae]
MAYDHWLPGVAAHNGHIYVVGDFKGSPAVGRYDPQQDTWSQICSLKYYGCGPHPCASFENKLWTIHHHVEEGRTGVAVYNEANDRWVQKSSLPKGSIYSCFVISLSLLTSK